MIEMMVHCHLDKTPLRVVPVHSTRSLRLPVTLLMSPSYPYLLRVKWGWCCHSWGSPITVVSSNWVCLFLWFPEAVVSHTSCHMNQTQGLSTLDDDEMVQFFHFMCTESSSIHFYISGWAWVSHGRFISTSCSSMGLWCAEFWAHSIWICFLDWQSPQSAVL